MKLTPLQRQQVCTLVKYFAVANGFAKIEKGDLLLFSDNKKYVSTNHIVLDPDRFHVYMNELIDLIEATE